MMNALDKPHISRRSELAERAALYRTFLEELGISQMAFADIVGIGRRTSQGYALGETAIPNPVMKMLKFLIAGKITLDEVGKA